MEKNEIEILKMNLHRVYHCLEFQNIQKANYILGRISYMIDFLLENWDQEDNEEESKEDEIEEKPSAWKKIDIKSTRYDLRHGRLYFVRGKNIRHMAASWNYALRSFIFEGKPVHAEEYCEIPE